MASCIEGTVLLLYTSNYAVWSLGMVKSVLCIPIQLAQQPLLVHSRKQLELPVNADAPSLHEIVFFNIYDRRRITVCFLLTFPYLASFIPPWYIIPLVNYLFKNILYLKQTELQTG